MADPQRSNPALEATLLSSSVSRSGETPVEGQPVTPDPLIGRRLKHFEVRKLLGRGGMGAVYLGWDTSLERQVALKVLDQAIGRDAGLLARFVREARAQARLRHPNVTQIYFIGEEEELHFFAMEYVEGQPLDQTLVQGERIPWAQALEYVIAAARALREALAQGFIHRDVKPSNLLLDKDGQVKIADFGLAKSLKGDSELTREGVIVGSPLYMAPEQGRAESVDHRADIYSLGCAFYHMLTGRPPFTAPTPVGVITRHVTDKAVPIRAISPEVPEPVERLIDRMMAKDPAQRPQTYDDLLTALEATRPGHQEHSGFWARGMALGVDLACLTMVSVFLPQWVVLTWPIYFILAHRLFGQTLGKRLLRLQVGDARGHRIGWKAAGLRTLVEAWAPLVWALVGLVIYFTHADHEFRIRFDQPRQLVEPVVYGSIFAVTFLGYLSGFLVAAFHPKKRALHDLLAGTFVTYKFPVARRPAR